MISVHPDESHEYILLMVSVLVIIPFDALKKILEGVPLLPNFVWPGTPLLIILITDPSKQYVLSVHEFEFDIQSEQDWREERLQKTLVICNTKKGIKSLFLLYIVNNKNIIFK